ncbi:MAG: response regulator [Sphaerochaeta sp.]|nr:response regulator [Sphaerochaeta sp.]
MFTVVMCDDESWVLKGLQTIIDWHAYGFSSIKAFQRPAEALATILASQPDLVITDVKMPGLSGLELMEQARERGNTSVFVIVSAYAEFDYVQRALDSGAFSYLLKPLEEEKVIEVAEKVSTVLKKRDESRVASTLKKLVLQTLTANEPVDMDCLRERGPHDGRCYRFYALSELPPASQGLWTQVHDELFIGVVEQGHRLQLPASWGRGGCFATDEDVPCCLREALIAYYTVLFHGRAEWHLSYQGPDAALHGSVRTLLEAVEEGDKARALVLVDEYETKCTEEGVSIDGLMLFYNTLLIGLLTIFPDSAVSENLQPFHDCFQMYGVLQTLERYVKTIRILVVNYTTEALSRDDQLDVGELAVQYVDQHYRQPITLEQLSCQFNVSLSHLCRQFKRACEMTFTEYLRKRRIDYACTLLRGTNNSVSEIGRQVGFEDYFYFNKVFKRAVGISPAAYRKGSGDE